MVRFAAAALALAVTSLGLSAHGSEILLLDFWSPSCGPCMQMRPLVQSLEQARYPIREVDTTRDWQLARQYNVDRIPCFVMLVDGQEIDRQVGATSIEHLQQMFEKAKDVVRQRQGSRTQSPDQLATSQGGRMEPGTARGPAPQPPVQPAPAQDPWNRGADSKTRPAPVEGTNPAAGLPIEPPTASASDFPPSLIAASVRIRVEDAQGRSFGTGTIIDARDGNALVITCGHLFRDSKGSGAMTVELFDVGPNGVQVVGQVPGKLLSYDLNRDVAFVEIHPNRQVSVAPLAPPRTSIQRGDRVATIGCSNGKDPTLLAQRITTLDRYQGPANIEVSGAPEEGRSGGGLFNLQGQLIGLCYAADYEGNEGLYAALDSIHTELDRVGLKDVVVKSEAPKQSGQAASKGSQPSVVRGQEPLTPLAPIPNIEQPAPSTTVAVTPADAKTSPPAGLNETERAAWDEIMKRATTSEVICIIRPKEPGAQSEVITLDGVSPEFVRALAERQRSPLAPTTR